MGIHVENLKKSRPQEKWWKYFKYFLFMATWWAQKCQKTWEGLVKNDV